MALRSDDSSSDESVSQISVKRRRIDLSDEDSESDDETFHRASNCRNNIYTSSESENDSCNDEKNNNNDDNDIKVHSADWSDPVRKQPRITPFAGKPGFKLSYGNHKTVEDIYMLLVSDEMFQVIAEETNRHAEQIVRENNSNRLNYWTPTNKHEVKQFFGLVMWMGLVKLPDIKLYWSKDPFYAQSFAPSVMSRNRFELLLRLLHFCNNGSTDTTDRLYKIQTIIDKLNENFQRFYEPSEILCMCKSLIPSHGRILCKEYKEQKEHRYEIKIYKLYAAPGYTSNILVCAEKMAPTNLVMTLCKNIFGKGHILCTRDLCTSIDLARKLIAEDTHLIGTIQQNCRGIPKDIITNKLQRNEQLAKENKDGITILRWKNKREVLLLSTKCSTETVVVHKKGYNSVIPRIIADYKKGKSYIDFSNQMAPYCTRLTKTIKWYKRIAFELFLNTAVVNAWIIYNSVTHSNMSSLEFRKRLAVYLTHCNVQHCKLNYSPCIASVTEIKRHELTKKEGKIVSVRRRCKGCYENNVKKFGSILAKNSTKRVITFCIDCPGKPFLCLPCFNVKHRDMSLR